MSSEQVFQPESQAKKRLRHSCKRGKEVGWTNMCGAGRFGDYLVAYRLGDYNMIFYSFTHRAKKTAFIWSPCLVTSAEILSMNVNFFKSGKLFLKIK